MKKTRVFLIVTLIAMILTMTLAIGFGAGTPGSEDDPIVTKGYVDQVVEALKEEMKKIQPETQAPSSTGWQVVQVPAKTTVIGETGTEMILRSGYASAVDLVDNAAVHDNNSVRHGEGFFLVVGYINKSNAELLLNLFKFNLHFFSEL